MKPLHFAMSVSATVFMLTGPVQAETTLNIATVNNADMAIMQQRAGRCSGGPGSGTAGYAQVNLRQFRTIGKPRPSRTSAPALH